MDPISGTSPFTLLLRQRLMERARLAEKAVAARVNAAEMATPPEVSALSSFVGHKGASDHEAHRALVEHLLGAEFGDHMLNQAKFQQLVEQVTCAMESDPVLSGQMAQILRSLT